MTEEDRQHLYASIEHHEGYRTKAYKDTLGHWTVGFGTNLEVLEIDLATARAWMHKKIEEVTKSLSDETPWSYLNGVRQGVLIEMGYQLGFAGCKKFVKMWEALGDHDYPRAAREMGNSRWARQTQKRVAELQARMLYGTWDGRRPGGE
jgi:lysozyme